MRIVLLWPLSLTVILLCMSGSAWGRELEVETELKNRIQELETHHELDSSQETQALAELIKAKDFIDISQRRKHDTEALLKLQKRSPEELRELSKSLEAMHAKFELGLNQDSSLEQIQQRLALERAELRSFELQLGEIDAQKKLSSGRHGQAPKELASAKNALSELTVLLASKAPQAGELTQQAEFLRLRAQTVSLRRQTELLEQELLSFDLRRSLLEMKSKLWSEKIKRAQQVIQRLEGFVTAYKEKNALAEAQNVAELKAKLVTLSPKIRAVLEKNKQLVSERLGPKGFVSRIDGLTEKLGLKKRIVRRLRNSLQSMERQLDVAGLSPAMGRVFHLRYLELPNLAAVKREQRLVQQELASAQFRQISLEDKRAELIHPEELSVLETDTMSEPMSGQTKEELQSAFFEVFSQQQQIVISLADDLSIYIARLTEFSTVLHELQDITRLAKAFIEERLFLVRSVSDEDAWSVGHFQGAVTWLASVGKYLESMQLASDGLSQKPIQSIGYLLAILVLALIRPKLRQATERYNRAVKRHQTDSVVWTMLCCLIIAIRCALYPLVILWFGWALSAPSSQTLLGIALGRALEISAITLYVFLVVRAVMRELGEIHFHWDPAVLVFFRKELHWFMPFCVFMLSSVMLFESVPNTAWRHSLGRLLFIVLVIGTAVFCWRLMSPRRSLYRAYVQFSKNNLLFALRDFWRLFFTFAFLFLGLLALCGYYYTSLEVAYASYTTLVLALLLFFLWSMLGRWLFIARRRAAIEQLRAKREAAREATDKSEIVPIKDEDLNLPAIGHRTRALFRTIVWVVALVGMYTIWASVLPALKIFDRVQIWPTVTIIDASYSRHDSKEPEVTSGATQSTSTFSLPMARSEMMSGQAQNSIVATADSVTLADAGLAIILLILVYAASRNLPAFIEIMILQRLSLDGGTRYAVSSIIKYIISISGITIACGLVGIGWGSIQWLAAALTFGLAFGLQEIFANFISGIILLFEQPIRVGDTVTVKGTIGTVSKIRMRATTIVDWSRKELLIPNKEFVTGEIINWSLSDSIVRVIIKVGIAYGSDTILAQKLLLQVASENELVLNEPKPQAYFLGFGDNSLNFELRAFIPAVEHYLTSQHTLHMEIDQVFRTHGIEIAFPQRDLHIRSAPALESLQRGLK